MAFHLLGELLDAERLDAVHPLEHAVLLGERGFEFLPQDLRIEDVLDANPESRRLVRIGWPDTAARRPDLQLAEAPLAGRVHSHVPRHDEMRVAGETNGPGRD